MRQLSLSLIFLLFCGWFSGCSSTSSRPAYHPLGQMGVAHRLERGTVVTARSVFIDGKSSLVGATLGGSIGTAVAIGAVGSVETPRDLRRTVGGAAVGAAAGAVAGQIIEKRLTERRAQELTVQMENGQRLIVVQVLGRAPFVASERVQVYTTLAGVSHVFHADENPYVDPETQAYLLTEEERERVDDAVSW